MSAPIESTSSEHPVPERFPRIQTERLVLRGIEPGDAPTMVRLAGDFDVAKATSRIPHPYTLKDAENWIALVHDLLAKKQAVAMAVARRDTGEMIGAVGLELTLACSKAELGYWIGKPWWGAGYATEAARGLLDWGFGVLLLDRIFAQYMHWNEASGRVLRKLGMRDEGVLRRNFRRFGIISDSVCLAMLREEWEAAQRSRG